MTSPTLSRLSISGVTGGALGSTAATLMFASGMGFDTPATLAVLAAPCIPAARTSPPAWSPSHPWMKRPALAAARCWPRRSTRAPPSPSSKCRWPAAATGHPSYAVSDLPRHRAEGALRHTQHRHERGGDGLSPACSHWHDCQRALGRAPRRYNTASNSSKSGCPK